MIKIIKPFRHAVSCWSKRAIALALVLLLVQAPQLVAQVSSISASQAATPMALHIVILDGENALNNIRQRSAREPIVQVEDENHKPVAAATVLFTIHSGASGAGGSFSGASTFSAVTGLDGQAVAKGLVPNGVQGSFSVTVTATIGTVTTSAVITQSNILGSFSSAVKSKPAQTTSSTVSHVGVHIFTKNFWVVAGGVGAATAAVVTAAVITRNSGATITPGGGTVKP
jgi:hypothetical protein